MGDFEERLGRALGDGAEDAPGAAGLAAGARTRARRRRTQRVAVGAAVALVAVAVPFAVVTSGSGPGSRGRDAAPVAGAETSQQEVTCGGGASWPIVTMDGGLPGVVNDAEVRAAFADVLAEAPMDAPTAIREDGADAASYIVLAGGGDSYILGIGPWSLEGPGRTAMSAGLERQPDGSLRMTGWGDCQLETALPPGRSLVEVTAPDGGVDPSTTAPLVMVSEMQCASARDPEPFLGEPVIVEDAERVLVTMTSDTVVGGASCPGNPSVPLTLTLDEPIGDRRLLDAGTFPPTPIDVAALTTSGVEWQTVTYEGAPVNESGDNTILLDLPPGWERLDTSECGFEIPRFGPVDDDPCDVDSFVGIYGSATFDACCPPGLVSPDVTDGYVYTSELVVAVAVPDYEAARRILASVRRPGEPAPSETWLIEDLGAARAEVPDDESVGLTIFLVKTTQPTTRSYAQVNSAGRWIAEVDVRPGTQVQVTAPTQALADVVASTVRPTG